MENINIVYIEKNMVFSDFSILILFKLLKYNLNVVVNYMRWFYLK